MFRFLSLPLLLLQSILTTNVPLVENSNASGVTTNGSLANGTFDYIIVGAGLAGTVVASRLSENASLSILLIEAGHDERSNPLIFDIYNYGQAFNCPCTTWHWPTDQGRGMLGGKTLGGGTSINGAAYTRGMKAQYDALPKLLETSDVGMNWTFESLFQYMQKSENFSAPTAQQIAKGASFNASYHGHAGPVQVTFPDLMFGGPQQPAFVNATTNLTGLIHCEDMNGGNGNCVSYNPHTINRQNHDHRSSSADAYLTPVEIERKGWLTLVGHRVTRVLLEGKVPKVNATGVEYKSTEEGRTFWAIAKKEVILAAGAISTPQLLQLSGIGNPDILHAQKITPFVNLTTVGKNLQEQAMNSLGHKGSPTFNPDGSGPSNVIAYPSLLQLFASSAGGNGSTDPSLLAAEIKSSYPSWAQSQSHSALSASALTKIFEVQAGLIVNHSAPVAELAFNTDYPTKGGVGINIWQLLPFSRGNVAIISPSVFDLPKVTVNYFSVLFDLQVQTAGARLSRKILDHPAFKNISAGEVQPGTTEVPNDVHGGTDAKWHDWINETFFAVSHPIGTCAMMRRDLGGVVDAHLRVYDTTNLRVVDASVLPLQVSAHLSSPLYGIAEKAADIIKYNL